MRKFCLFSLLLSMAIVACQKDVYEQPYDATNDDVAQSCKSTTISVEQALKNLDDLVNVLYPETRTGKAKTYSKESVLTYVTPATTRSSSKIELPDTLVYIVNFDDGEGFALLGAQSNLSSVYSVTESGTFDVDKFSEALNYEIEHNLLTPEEYAARVAAEQEEEIEYGDANNEDIAYNIMAGAVLTDSTGPLPWQPSPDDPPVIDGGIVLPPIPDETIVVESIDFVENYDQMLTTEWHQEHPFNLLCTDDEGNDCPAGCPVIAVAQIMAFHEIPQDTTFNGIPVNWDTVKQYNKDTTYDNESAVATQLSNLCYELGKRANCNINYSTTGSDGNVLNCKQTLQNYGYLNVERHLGHGSNDREEIYKMIKNGKIVLFAANRNVLKGHIFLLDGYIARRTKTVTTNIYSNGSIKTTTSYGDTEYLYHINWGKFYGENGYYIVDNDFIEGNHYDAPDDTTLDEVDGYRYHMAKKYITYDLPDNEEE